ncbi:hypothetical protein E7756_24650, partial [Salmonella enterica]|nr:hypothetical protein [Salmonella enterica]
ENCDVHRTTTRRIADVPALTQETHPHTGKPGKGRWKKRLTVCFFIFYCSPLFTIRKKISNTVS